MCITLLLGGNIKSQDAFFVFFQEQDPQNIIMQKLKKMLMETFDLTKKFITEKNAKLSMKYKMNQRKLEEENDKKIPDAPVMEPVAGGFGLKSLNISSKLMGSKIIKEEK